MLILTTNYSSARLTHYYYSMNHFEVPNIYGWISIDHGLLEMKEMGINNLNLQIRKLSWERMRDFLMVPVAFSGRTVLKTDESYTRGLSIFSEVFNMCSIEIGDKLRGTKLFPNLVWLLLLLRVEFVNRRQQLHVPKVASAFSGHVSWGCKAD